MRKFSRKIFRNSIESSKARKALELYLFVKSRYVSSTINNFTYTKLSAATRLSRESLKKRIQTLKDYATKLSSELNVGLCIEVETEVENVCVGMEHRSAKGSSRINIMD